MTPDDWRVVIEQTGIAGICFTAFIVGLRRRWWVMGSEANYIQSIADRFMSIADRLIAREEQRTINRSDE